MNGALWIAWLLAQSPTPSVPTPSAPTSPVETTEAAETSVEPWKDTLADGLAELRSLSNAGKPDEALALAERLLAPDAFSRWREKATAHPGWKRRIVEAADPLLATFGLSDRTSAERATIHLARGIVLAGAERRGEAAEAFEKARALAGPGELRLDATYDLGWTALAEGEALRAKIPEVAGPSAPPQPPSPAAPPTAQGLPGQPQSAPDPLALAREAYLAARERFVERLRSQWDDADTRANVELVQRRLRELAEIEKKREEEKKKQEQQQKEQEKQDGEQNKDEQKQDQDKKDPQEKDQEQKDGQGEQPKPDEQKPEPKPDEPKPEEQKPEEANEEKKGEQPQPAPEEQLSKEEVMRLLELLKGREQEGQKLLEQLRQARRATVKKDW